MLLVLVRVQAKEKSSYIGAPVYIYLGEKMKRLLWLDDFRNPADFVKGDYIISWVKNYKEFCTFINENGLPNVVCFDHDLGEEKSGYDCAKFLVKYCQKNCLDIPEYDIQSSNTVGKDNIRGLMDNWHRFYLEGK